MNMTRRHFFTLLTGAVALYLRPRYRLVYGAGDTTWGDETFDTAEQAYHRAFMAFATTVNIPLGLDAARALYKRGKFSCPVQGYRIGFWAHAYEVRGALVSPARPFPIVGKNFMGLISVEDGWPSGA
jgi:hypothetical protein